MPRRGQEPKYLVWSPSLPHCWPPTRLSTLNRTFTYRTTRRVLNISASSAAPNAPVFHILHSYRSSQLGPFFPFNAISMRGFFGPLLLLLHLLTQALIPGPHLASWLVMRRSRARSSLAPRASLLRFAVFSSDSTTRCFERALFSMRARPDSMSRISACAESVVCIVAANDGAVL